MTEPDRSLDQRRLDRARDNVDQAFDIIADANYGMTPRTVLTIPQGTEPDCPREHGPMDPELIPHGTRLGMARCVTCGSVEFYRHGTPTPDSPA